MSRAEPSRFWWLKKAKYVAIFLRELTSFFILGYVLLYLGILSQIQQGKGDLLGALATPPFIVLSLTILAFTLYHSVTWLIAIPKVQPVRIGSFLLRGNLAFVVNLGILLFASLIVALLVFGI
jgi:fumarate reductase subunit C